MFPSGLDGLYKNNDQPTKRIIKINGISEIKNIKYTKCEENIKKYFKNMNLLTEGNKYPHPYLHYLYNVLNVRFDITYTALSYRKKHFEFSKEDIEKKNYKKIYGVFMMDNTHREYELHGSDETLKLIIEDLQETGEYKILDSEIKNIRDNEEENIKDSEFITITKEKEYMRNLSYMSSYMVGYSLIELLEKIKFIKFEDIKRLNCDSITTDKKYLKLFTIEKGNPQHWKIERTSPNLYESDTFLNCRDFDIKYNEVKISLSYEKLKYGTINLITGKAGSGKSSRFHKVFEKDERLKNALYIFPTNDLCADFYEKYDCPTLTYQKLIYRGFELSEEFKTIVKYKNLIIDECTFIDKREILQIRNLSRKYNFNLFYIGDLDENRAYQLQSVTGENIDMNFMRDNFETLHHLHLTKVHRNGGELLDRLNKIRENNMTNDEIKILFNDRITDKIEYKPSLQNIILCPVNKEVAKYNIEYYEETKNGDTIIQKDPKTTRDKKEIKNRRRLIKKNEFKYSKKLKGDDKEINKHLGYAITSHISQGKTYEGQIYIIVKNLYCENLLYVMLSRATKLENIFLIY